LLLRQTPELEEQQATLQIPFLSGNVKVPRRLALLGNMTLWELLFLRKKETKGDEEMRVGRSECWAGGQKKPFVVPKNGF